MAYFLLKLNEIKDSLTRSERLIAQYIVENPEEVLACSIEVLAARSKSSKSAIVRLCKTLGCSGYRQLLIDISSELAIQNHTSKSYSDIETGDGLEVMMSSIAKNNIASIENTIKIVDKTNLTETVNILSQDERRVFLFGIGASGMVACDAWQKLVRIGKNVSVHVESHEILTISALLKPTDLVLCFSNSGSTTELVSAATIARTNGAFVISITKYGKSYLSEQSDIALHYSSNEISVRSAAMSSRIAMLTMVDVIFSAVAANNLDMAKANLEKTYQVLKK